MIKLIPWFFICIITGSILPYFYYRKKIVSYRENIRNLEHDKILLSASLNSAREQEKLMEDFSNKLIASSQSLMKELKEDSQDYFSEKTKNIESILNPVQQTFVEFKQNLKNFEIKNAEDRSQLKERLSYIIATEQKLAQETQNLTNILKHPGARGRWGEIQLERILELSGMQPYCDYEKQVTDTTGQSRPDMIIRLPQDRCLIIDSKAPFSDILLSENLAEEAHDLVAKIKLHIKTLKSKNYSNHFQGSPEFVILFLPTESIYNLALHQAPELFDFSAHSNVILSGPSSLLALLKTIGYTWKQENLTKQIQKIGDLGQELHKRFATFISYLYKTGKHLDSAVQAYNNMSASLQTRLLPTFKKFEQLEVSSPQKIDEPGEPIDSPQLSFLNHLHKENLDSSITDSQHD